MCRYQNVTTVTFRIVDLRDQKRERVLKKKEIRETMQVGIKNRRVHELEDALLITRNVSFASCSFLHFISDTWMQKDIRERTAVAIITLDRNFFCF